jgi:hypothetical protein
MKLQEVLNKPVSYRWRQQSSDNWAGSFEIDNNEYIWEAESGRDLHSFEIVFAMKSNNSKSGASNYRDDVTKSGNEFKVFATVAKMTDDFIKKEDPKKFSFTAKEKSRQKLYNRFAKQLAYKYGYEYSGIAAGSKIEYTFSKRE